VVQLISYILPVLFFIVSLRHKKPQEMEFDYINQLRKDREKLGYEEFRQVVLENISKVITNQSHIEDNSEFYNMIIFKLFEKYQNDLMEDYTINQVVKMFDIFLYSMFKYSPSTKLPEDLI
jgi:hypothetical protein